MVLKNNSIESEPGSDSLDIVTWEEKYATGIELIDVQHRELVSLINELFRACRMGNEVTGFVFKEAMSRMVEYVRFHFSAEQKLMERINYPERHDHQKRHESLIRDILAAAKDYNEGKKMVAHQFVRTLKDWVLGHIAVHDKIYAAYIMELKKKGLFDG